MKWLTLAGLVLTACPAVYTVGHQTVDLGKAPTDAGTADAGPGCPANSILKVLFIVDEGQSMCVYDPPGSSSGFTFCEEPEVVSVFGDVEVPAREAAILNALKEMAGAGSQGSDIAVAMLPFETDPMPAWPASSGARCTTGCFSDVDARDGNLSSATSYADGLASDLGNGSNLEAALDEARQILLNDIEATSASTLASTQYVVALLSAGLPTPRCTATPNLPSQDYATAAEPGLTWQDDSSYCTVPAWGGAPLDGGVAYELPDGGVDYGPLTIEGVDGFDAGTDLNQDYQLLGEVTAMVGYQQTYGVGGITFDTAMTLDEQALEACGQFCMDRLGFSGFSNGPDSLDPSDSYQVAVWTMNQLAATGHGTFIQISWASDAGFGDGGPNLDGLHLPIPCDAGTP